VTVVKLFERNVGTKAATPFLVLMLLLLATSSAHAEYYIFAGGHVGNSYYDEITDETMTYKLDEKQVGNNGLDIMAAWGNEDYGIGFTYTTGQHLVKTELTGVRLHQKMSGPGIIFSTIYQNPQKAKTMSFIGVESLTINNSNTSCTGNELQCEQLEKDLDGSSAKSVILGIIDTSASGIAIGLVGRAYQSDAIERGYDLNLLIGIGL
jgi:hypothetical protein